MGWNYSIISRADAHEPSPARPPTAIGTFRAIHDWITTHAAEWELYPGEPDRLTVPIGKNGYVSVRLVTARYRQMLAEPIREQKRHGHDTFALRDYMRAYVPRDDEAVVEIGVDGWGAGNLQLLAHLAAWLGAVAVSSQSSRVLTPDEWLRECADYQEPPDPEPFEDVISWDGMWWNTDRREKPGG
jgi:hypothetical protein